MQKFSKFIPASGNARYGLTIFHGCGEVEGPGRDVTTNSGGRFAPFTEAIGVVMVKDGETGGWNEFSEEAALDAARALVLAVQEARESRKKS